MVGAYLLASEKAFTGAVPQLCGLAKALRAEAGDDSLLLHIDAATGKVHGVTYDTSKVQLGGSLCGMAEHMLLDIVYYRCVQTSLKEYAGGAPSGAAGLKPVDLRFVPLRPAFQTLLCSLDVDMTVPVPKASQARVHLCRSCKRCRSTSLLIVYMCQPVEPPVERQHGRI